MERRKQDNLKRVLLMLRESHHKDIKSIARYENLSASEIVRKALEMYIKDWRRKYEEENTK